MIILEVSVDSSFAVQEINHISHCIQWLYGRGLLTVGEIESVLVRLPKYICSLLIIKTSN